MAKSLEELELAFQAKYPKVETKQETKVETKQESKQEIKQESKIKTKQESKSDTVSISILDIIFYLVLALMLVGVIIFSREASGNRTIGGRHFYEVTNTSMQSIYPKGSLVLARDIEANTLIVGDDIIFQSEDNEIIISRIIEIKEELDETNNQVFVALGVDETAENSELVPANKLTGKVTRGIPFAGEIINWIGNNLWIGFVALGVVVIIFVCTKIFRRKDKRKDKVKKNQAYLVLIAITFLSILIGGSYQRVEGKELAPLPTQIVAITPAINPQTTGRGKVVPVNMSQSFLIVAVGMASLKLLSIMIKRDRRKHNEQ